MARQEEGMTAPDFTLPTAGGGTVNLRESAAKAEKGVVVYFYPRAMTPGCTKEACDFRDSESVLRAAGYTVIGISPDKIASLDKFAEKKELNFVLASDPDRDVMRRWGAYGEKKNYGRIVQGVIRSTFVVDRDCRIVLAKYNVRATGHVQRLCKELGLV